MIKVTIWDEYFHEQREDQPEVRALYPEGIHRYLANVLKDEFEVKTTSLAVDGELRCRPDCGITKELLDDTDVLIWWAHYLHHEVSEEAANLVADYVRRGMGIIFLHSAHCSKPFQKLVGTSCNLNWREPGCKERLWPVNASHPIAKGIGDHILIPIEEVYGEPFGIPEPDELVFIGGYEDGEVFRSGCCFKRQLGKIFYFQPGHESYPTYHIPEIQTVIRNAVKWCYNDNRDAGTIDCNYIDKPND